MKRSPPRSGRGQSACGELKQKNILRCCHCCLSKKMSLISVLILIFILILYIESVQNNKVMALDRIHSNLARTITEVDECCQFLLIIFFLFMTILIKYPWPDSLPGGEGRGSQNLVLLLPHLLHQSTTLTLKCEICLAICFSLDFRNTLFFNNGSFMILHLSIAFVRLC